MSDSLNVNISTNNNLVNGRVNTNSSNLNSSINNGGHNVQSNVEIETINLNTDLSTEDISLTSGLCGRENSINVSFVMPFSGSNFVRDVIVNGQSVVNNHIAYIVIPSPIGIEYIYLWQQTGILNPDDLNTLTTNISTQLIYNNRYYTLGLKNGNTRRYFAPTENQGTIIGIDIDMMSGIWNCFELNAVQQHIQDTTIHITEQEREFWNNKINCEMHEELERLELTRE